MLKYIKQPDVSRKMQDLWVSVKLYQLTTSFVPKKVERILCTKNDYLSFWLFDCYLVNKDVHYLVVIFVKRLSFIIENLDGNLHHIK